MGRIIFYALIFYLIFRLLDRFIMPAFRGGGGSSSRPSEPKKPQQDDSKKDWGGKYVDYEDVTGKEDKED